MSNDKDIRVCDLPEHPKYGVKLFCPDCLSEGSATAGDYFFMDPNAVLLCCGEPLRLVRERCVLEDIDPLDAEDE